MFDKNPELFLIIEFNDFCVIALLELELIFMCAVCECRVERYLRSQLIENLLPCYDFSVQGLIKIKVANHPNSFAFPLCQRLKKGG